MKSLIFIYLVLSTSISFSQSVNYSLLQIPDSLKENSNSVLLNQEVEIIINSQKSYTKKIYKVIRVFNELGLKNIDAIEYYNKSLKIKWLDVTVYNIFGKEIKKFKQKDFKDTSVADGFSVLTDNRMVYLDYTPTEYPFTLIYYSETESSNTAFLPRWFAVENPYESVLKNSIKITYPNDLGFKYKTQNFTGNIIKKESINSLSFQGENIKAFRYEDMSPTFNSISPMLMCGLEKFNLEGYDGVATNWKDFGLWMYNNLLKETEEIDSETIEKVSKLIGTETNPEIKAKIIYKYLQDKTRYVSVQLGIGGWKPMLAKDVDRLGYGDCKALSNYTRSLLKYFNIPAYYTIIYAGNDKRNIDSDFVSMQGNHAILAYPINEKYKFLECTNQTSPFGFEGDFTDDRFALVIKPDGGEIVKTNSYNEKNNNQKINASYIIKENGDISANVTAVSKGIYYDNAYPIELKEKDKIIEHYKNVFSEMLYLKIDNYKFQNNKDRLEFVETINCNATSYAKISGNSLMFTLNAFNKFQNVPQRYRDRKNPFEIQRGFFDEDEIEITMPENYIIDAKPNNVIINDKFGEYKLELIVLNSTTLKYKRTFLLKKGIYDKSEYEAYRKFAEQIAKADASKILITKKL
ncbi:MAG: DUF3857 domain-containing protein [Flavobacterium sp.]